MYLSAVHEFAEVMFRSLMMMAAGITILAATLSILFSLLSVVCAALDCFVRPRFTQNETHGDVVRLFP